MQRLCKEMMRCMQVARNDIEIESAVERPDELCDSIDAVMCHLMCDVCRSVVGRGSYVIP